jgi:predicted NBD/HSP70 family sugar kinase
VEWLQEEHTRNNKTCKYNNWPELLDGARHGNALCIKALDRLIEYLSAGLVTLINLFDPECIFLGEDYAQATDLLAPQLTELINRRKFFSKETIIPVKASYFMGAAPLISPVAYAIHMILSENALPA